MLAALLLGFAAVYLIPFHISVTDGFSDSYVFGYNNRAGTLLLFLLTLGFALWTSGLYLTVPDSSRTSASRFLRTYSLATVCSILACLGVWLWARTLSPFDEATYFLDRYATYAMGLRLYSGFSFDYGPLMFYPAIWIARVFHVSLGNGYFLAWILQWTLGTWVLWRTVLLAARGTAHGRAIFLLLWAFFLTGIPDGGPNYTPLRFCSTLLLALSVHSLYTRRASNFTIFGFACSGGTAMLLYSPEQGIAFTLGTMLFFALCIRPFPGNLLRGLAGFAVTMACIFLAAARFGLLGNIATVGAGGLNFPILFSFQSLVLFLLLIVAACAVVAAFRARASNHPLLYLICVSLVSAPAAFSRADMGHVILNTLGALVAALIVLSQYPAFWRWTWPSFALVVLLSSYGKFTYYEGVVRNHIHDAVFGGQFYSSTVDKTYTTFYTFSHKDAQARLDALRATVRDPIDPKLAPLPAGTRLLAPLGVQRRLTPVPNGIQIVTGRYPWLFPLSGNLPIQQKIAEMEAHADWPLLLPSKGPQVCVFDPFEQRRTLRKFLLAPYLPPPRHTMVAAKPFCDYINANFSPSSYASPIPHSFIWVHNTSDTGTASAR